MTSTIVSMEDILGKTKTPTQKHKSMDITDPRKNKPKLNSSTIGKPKSGRFWKNQKTRFSSIVKTKGVKQPFSKKEALRAELKRVKDASRAIIAAKQEEKEQKKERRRENIRKQEENRKKSEIVQVIKNTSKLKRMKKKQLRFIEKRDTNDT